MRNHLLRVHTAEDIDSQIDTILRGLGNPPPPLSLPDVRELLKLDLQFYSSTNHSAIREIASRIYVAGKQILARPGILLDAIKKADLKALYIPDRRRILIDEDLPKLKHRWNEAHEMGHSVIPWHKNTMMGDDRGTLSPACHEQTENEANYAAGRLLFLRDRFGQEFNSSAPSLQLIRDLKGAYGNTITATLWRAVEVSPYATFGAVSCHPKRLAVDHDPLNPLSYYIRSARFLEKFSNTHESQIWERMQSYSTGAKGGTLGAGEVQLVDDNGQQHWFVMETFFNSYEALTLGVYLKPTVTSSIVLATR